MTPPAVLYKYCSPERIDVLECTRIRFTPSPKLNDAFEMTPIVTFDAETNVAVQDRLAAVNRMPRLRPQPLSQPEEENIVASTLESCLCLCLTDVWDSALMWSYYADGHKGFVIGFDTTNSDLFPEPPARVSYSKVRSQVGFYKSFHDAVYTKADYWKHEREWRAIRTIEFAAKLHLERFTTKAVTEVIFGNRMSAKCRNRVLGCIHDVPYSHVRLYDLKPHPAEWSLQRDRVID